MFVNMVLIPMILSYKTSLLVIVVRCCTRNTESPCHICDDLNVTQLNATEDLSHGWAAAASWIIVSLKAAHLQIQ